MINSYVNKQEYEQELLGRWNWITEEIDDAELKLNTSMVLENSYGKMVGERSIPKNWLEDNILSEDVLNEAPMSSGAVGDYVIPKVMFPIIRRVMPELIANKIVSVQPITQPTGVIYYITYKYSNTKGEIVKGNEFSANPQQTTPGYAVFYTSEKLGPFEVTPVTADDTAGYVDISTGTKITGFLGTAATPDYKIKRFELFNVTTGRGISGVKFGGTVYDGTIAAGDTIGFKASDGTIRISDTLFTKAVVGQTNFDKIRAFLVYDQEGSDKIPEMEFTIDYASVQTTERKLKVRWTKESEQDMQAYHKIDVESELVKVSALQTNYEIDREIIGFIGDRVIPELSFTHDWTADSSVTGNNTAGNFLDRHRAFSQKLYLASSTIAQYNKMGPASWAVTSPQTAALLQMLPDFKGEISNNKNTMYNAGNLGGNLDIYVDPNRYGADANEIVLGYKSTDSTYGAGVVYSPYANWMSSTVTHPETFDSIRGFFSRYAVTMVPRGEYHYGKVQLAEYGV